MKNYGLRISKDEYNVKTCDDIDCVITSKYSNLKGIFSGAGSINVPHNTTQTVTINHNLGYPVIVRMFLALPIYIDPDFYEVYQEIPIYDTGSVWTFWEFDAYSDSDNTYLDFYWADGLGGSSNTFDYKYLIFIDKAKL